MNTEEPIAIVGYGYRMPGGIRSDADFWRLLAQREVVREPVFERYGRGHRPLGGTRGFDCRFASAWEGLMRDGEELLFDYRLFGISQNEAKYMDPQMKLLLTCAWETFEHAGWDLHRLRNSPTGVFVGTQLSSASAWRSNLDVNEFILTGKSLAMLANRVSYQFNLMGPSISVNTACSAGMSALHAAVNALRQGDCRQALVGSVNYLGAAAISAHFNALGVISADGRCHSFDAAANGYMRSEGTFLTALKPLAAAERDGDLVHAVVEATAVNTAGTADDVFGLEPGRYITAPTRHAQVALMRAACARAGRTPREFDYVEAHATGTRLGDRIEGDSIGEAFGGFERGEPLRVSSVKSNVGHMEAAAFHCSLLKIVLMMQRRTFAPISGNFVAPNPEIDFAGHNMQVQTACEPFPDRPVVVGINSFGFGGANGHCVLGEYRPARRPRPSVALAPRAGFMFPVSARSADALAATVGRLRNTLAERPADLYTLAGNLSRRRTHFAARTAFVARSHNELLDALDAFRKEPGCSFAAAAGERRLVMVFAGQGTQWAGCARTLYDTHPVFRRAVDAIETHWRTHADLSLREACFAASQEALDECRLAQPCIFMIQCALVEVFKTWGVYPDCVVGHSSGEAAAAYACGALSLADATRLIFHRSTLQQRTAGSGRMLAIGLDRPGVEALLAALGVPLESSEPASAAVTIACENSPANTVICGREAVLQPVREELDRRRLQHRLLRGDIAFHSPAMEPIRHDVLESLSFLDDRTFDGDAPFVSSVTGLETYRLDARYWWSNIRRPVRFAAAMETVGQVFRPHVVLEVSPHGALRALVNQCFEDAADRPTSIATLTKDSDARTELHRALGSLFQTGVQLDFAAQYPRPEPVAHLLPGHPKDEKPVIDPLIDDETFIRQGRFSHGPLVGRRIPGDGMRFEVRLSGKTFPDLLDHRVDGVAIVPAAGYVEMVLEALGDGPVHFDELDFARPCPIPTRVPVYLQTVLQQVAGAEEQFTFTISSHPIEGDTSEVHCRGAVRRVTGDCAVDAPRRLEDVDATRFEPTWCTQPDDFYERIDATLGGNFQYGPAFRTVQRIGVDAGNLHLLAETAMDEGAWKAAREEGALWPAPLLDSALQLSIFFQLETSDTSAAPKGARRVTLFRPPSTPRLICHWKLSPSLRNVREKGQLAARMESASVGAASLYDAATGDLVGHVGDYSVGVFRDKRSRLPRSRHVVHWQPKFVPASFADGLPTGDLEPAALVAALERAGAGRGVHHALHVAEFAAGRVPDQTILEECIGHLASARSQSEYWLLADDADNIRAHYEAFHHHDAALRFECLSLDARTASGPDAGRLGPAAVELVFVHADGVAPPRRVWRFLRRLSVPGGLALVRHDAGDAVAPGDGWSVVRAGRRTTLLQAPQTWAEIETAEGTMAPRGLRWVIGEPGSGVDAWLALPELAGARRIPWKAQAAGEAQSPESWPAAADLEALDFFCSDDGQDPTGEALVAGFVALVQALISHRTAADRVCRLTVVTQGAAFEVRNPRGAALCGAVRSLAAEVAVDARLDFRLVDVGASSDLQTLVRLSLCDLRERELAVRQGRLWAPRLISLAEEFARVPAADDPPYRLFVDRPGQITALRMRTCEAVEPGPRDVEIEVRAAGLNFRDVMVALDLLPPLSYERSALGREVGMEGSGTVRGVGRAVRRCRVGDEVVFLTGGCIANRVAADDRLVFLKPERLSMAEAAAGLSAHLTAYYALIHLARLRPGQRVLIHSAMGGVGQAALALARHVGAEIYATAGTPQKRGRLLALGAKGAFDSHSHGWYDDLLRATGGEGIDVVLNSLAGSHLALCLDALRPGGCHCEIGKLDIYADNALGLRVFRKNLRFVAVDVDRLMLDDPGLLQRLSRTCLDLLATGALPAPQVTAYRYAEAADALRLMMNGRHEGKLVLEAPVGAPDFPVADNRPLLDPGATYLVTGGLSGFGLRVVAFLAASGARHLTLVDRDPRRGRTADWLRRASGLTHMFPDAASEVELDIVSGDVGEEEDVRRCVAELRRPLKGVFHLAGVLDDRALADLTPESIGRVFAPKARGALNLHRATADCRLDHFVLFSSLTSTLGNPGQISYGGASAFLDGLAAARRRQGLPALAYNMGAIVETGMATRNLHVLRMMKAGGLTPISSLFAAINLDYAMRTMSDSDHLVTALFDRPWRVDSADYLRCGRLMSNQDAFDAGPGDLLTVDAVAKQITGKVAELCGHDAIAVEEPLSSFGFSSISVAELGVFVRTQFNYQVGALELMTTATAQSLAEAIVHGHTPAESAEADEAASAGEPAEDAPGDGQVRSARRRPSIFAHSFDEHFAQEVG